MNRYLKSAARMLLCISCAVLNASVIQITSEEEFNAITASKPIAIEFYASWCSVCQHINKPFRAVAQDAEFKDVTFAQIDINKLTPLCKKLGIMGVPTFIYMNGGKKVHQSVGIHDIKGFAKEFRKSLRHHFGPLKATTAEPLVQIAAPTLPAVAPQCAAPSEPEPKTIEPMKAPETTAQEPTPTTIAAATPEPAEELPSVDVPAPEIAHIATALANASAAALEAESSIEEIEPAIVIEEEEEEEEEIAPSAPEIIVLATPNFKEPEYTENAPTTENASAPAPALHTTEKAIATPPAKPDARKIITESNAPALTDEQRFRAWLGEIWTEYYAICSTAAQSAYTTIATPISAIGSSCTNLFSAAYTALCEYTGIIMHALRCAYTATLEACATAYTSCAHACSAGYMYSANAVHHGAHSAQTAIAACTNALSAGYAYCAATCSTVYSALTTQKSSELTPMPTTQPTAINHADEQTFRAWLGEIWTAYINTITNAARASIESISAYIKRLKPTPTHPAHMQTPEQATAVETESPIEATELIMEPAEETVDVIPDIYRADETDIQAASDDAAQQPEEKEEVEVDVEEEIEEVAPEEETPEILPAQETASDKIADEPTYEDEEVYLIDDMSDITFLQWIGGIAESFIDMVVNVVLWLPRTIIGLCNLLLK